MTYSLIDEKVRRIAAGGGFNRRQTFFVVSKIF